MTPTDLSLTPHAGELARPKLSQRGLNGEQILEALLELAQEVDNAGTQEALKVWWSWMPSPFWIFVDDLAVEKGHNTPYENGSGSASRRRPVWSFNQQHHNITRSSVNGLVPLLTQVDDGLIEMDPRTELMIVTYHINYSPGQTSGYFYRRGTQKAVEAYGVGPRLAAWWSAIYCEILEGQGLRDYDKTEQEIIELLGKNRVTHPDRKFDFFIPCGEDFFAYNGRIVGLTRDTHDDTKNKIGIVDLLWGIGVYTACEGRDPELRGYTKFDTQEKIKGLLK